MEFTLHRELKRLYAGPAARCEVRLGPYIIDCVVEQELIEIQHGRLGAIRDKVRDLLETHALRVVKPIITRKTLCKRQRPGGRAITRRRSPKCGSMLDIFGELLHFTNVYPHQRLILEVPLIEVEEWRYPGHGRRRRWRKNDFVVEDVKLIRLVDLVRLSAAADLRWLLGAAARCLPEQFHTGDLAAALNIPRWQAQQMAYVFRQCGTARIVGKRRGAWLYEWREEHAQAESRDYAA
jgi:hypothetical protein